MGTDARVQGRSFGEAAETYDRVRPTYPPGAVSLLADRGARGRVLELGAGTGKLTRLLAPHAERLVAVEPDSAMAVIGRRHLGDQAEWVERAFEDWRPPSSAFDLVACAQAWHWLDQRTRALWAASALAPHGWLALLWNRPDTVDQALEADIDEAYERHAPEIAARSVCAAPSSSGQPTAQEELAGLPLFAVPETHEFAHTVRYRTAEHRQLLDTMSDCRMLEPDRRRALLDELSAVIDARGGAIEIRYRCRVVSARRLPSAEGDQA